jgi:hypothetical protein
MRPSRQSCFLLLPLFTLNFSCNKYSQNNGLSPHALLGYCLMPFRHGRTYSSTSILFLWFVLSCSTYNSCWCFYARVPWQRSFGNAFHSRAGISDDKQNVSAAKKEAQKSATALATLIKLMFNGIFLVRQLYLAEYTGKATLLCLVGGPR